MVNVPVWSLDDSHRLVIRTLTHAFRTARSPVLRVTTASGRFVHLTETHMLLTPTGWEPLTNLVSGSVLAVNRTLPDPQQVALQDPADLEAHMQDTLDGECAGIPDVVGSAPRPQLAELLQRVWRSHGSVRASDNGDVLYIDSTSLSISQTMSLVLSRFGVHVDIGTWNGGLTIRDSACVRAFLTGVLRPEDLTERARLLLERVSGDPTPCPGADGAIRWERIESIELRGIEEVYDVSVPDTNVIIGNGIALHRCQMRS